MSCPHCNNPDAEVVAIKHLEFEAAHRRGNPYRRECRGCGRHVCMTSQAQWRASSNQLVLPPDSDDADEAVPNDEYDGDTIDADTESDASDTTEYECPYSDCTETFNGELPECPGCERTLNWSN